MPLVHKEFRAWITCDGKTVKQYMDDVDEDTATCWIPSEVGSKFEVHWRSLKPEEASSGHVFVDGRDVASAIIRPGSYAPVKRSGAKTKDGLRPFTFAKLELTDNESIANPVDPSLMDLGAIELRVTLVRLGPPVKFEGYDAEDRGPVHEKAKKMGGHYTKFGEATQGAKSRAVSTAPLDPERSGPHVRFIFRYRSLEMLQATGIAPAPPAAKKRVADDEAEEIEDVSSQPASGRRPKRSRIVDSEDPEPAPRSSETRALSEGTEDLQDEKKPLFLDDEEENPHPDMDIEPSDSVVINASMDVEDEAAERALDPKADEGGGKKSKTGEHDADD